MKYGNNIPQPWEQQKQQMRKSHRYVSDAMTSQLHGSTQLRNRIYNMIF